MADFTIVEYPAFSALVKVAKCRHDELGTVIGQLYGDITAANPNTELIDAPCLFYPVWEAETCDIVAALPVAKDTVAGAGTEIRDYEGCTALQGVHTGPYTGLPQAWTAMWNYIQTNNIDASGVPWDRYVTDPGMEPDSSKWVTEIYVPIRIARIA